MHWLVIVISIQAIDGVELRGTFPPSAVSCAHCALGMVSKRDDRGRWFCSAYQNGKTQSGVPGCILTPYGKVLGRNTNWVKPQPKPVVITLLVEFNKHVKPYPNNCNGQFATTHICDSAPDHDITGKPESQLNPMTRFVDDKVGGCLSVYIPVFVHRKCFGASWF